MKSNLPLLPMRLENIVSGGRDVDVSQPNHWIFRTVPFRKHRTESLQPAELVIEFVSAHCRSVRHISVDYFDAVDLRAQDPAVVRPKPVAETDPHVFQRTQR